MERSQPVSMSAKVLAAAGDATVLVAFAAIGRSSHDAGDGGPVLGTLGTAAPFLVGWFLAGIVGGTYRDRAFETQGESVRAVVRSWLSGCLIGCGIRSAIEHHLTPPSFVAIALAFNLALLLGWRAALVRALPEH
jgi:Protein of unknown function (DUF3054)